MSTTTVERQHREAEGPLNSHVEQDKTTKTTTRDRDQTGAAGGMGAKKQTTTYQHAGLPQMAQQLIPNVNKQQLSLILPVVLAVVLALALLAYRGHFFSPAPKTWKDHVSEGVQNVGAGLKEGLNSAYDTATKSGSKNAEYAKQKAAEAADYAKNKGSEGASYAYDKAAEAAAAAKAKAGDAASTVGDAASDAYHRTVDAAGGAYDSAKETVTPHPTLLGKASEYVHDKVEQLYDSVKHVGQKSSEQLRHEANILAEDARHAAAQAGNKAGETYDNAKATAHDTKRDVKSKMGY